MATDAPQPPVDTANPALRRALRFSSLDQALAEAERIGAADQAGRLTRKGNWTAGQALGHLAAWINFGFDGYTMTAPPELAARALARKPTALREGLMSGFRIPGIPEGTAGTEVLSVEEGARRFRAACARLAAATPTHPHPFFGPLTRDEWLLLHLRHSELHLSYLHPETA